MRKVLIIIAMLMAGCVFFPTRSLASDTGEGGEINVQHIIFEHMLDSYSWHITKIGEKDVVIYLPVILYSKTSGWHFFSSRRLHENGGSYEGFYPAPEDGPHAYKLMEKMPDGSMVRPIDLSLTKLVDMVEDGIIKPCIGENYKKFSPYLLTAFFFIFTCNLMSLLPIFPGGVGVTANISITMFLALCTFIAVNVFGSREYWREILWPDVPTWLKAPVPLMPFIELIGIFTKPIALMIRLFANMLGGHMAMLVLTVLIFIGFSASAVMGTSMTVLSVLFNIFMYALELLVAYIQAYVFTLLSAVFIGSAQIYHHKKAKEESITETDNTNN